MDERFEAFTVLINKIARNIKRLKSEQMEALDLKGPHVSCMYYLYRDGELTAAELCQLCQEDKASVSRSLDYLEKSGYVTSSGKYKSPLCLTSKGQRAGEEIARRADSIVQAAGRDLQEHERLIMYRCLENISENLEQLYRKQKENEK